MLKKDETHCRAQLLTSFVRETKGLLVVPRIKAKCRMREVGQNSQQKHTYSQILKASHASLGDRISELCRGIQKLEKDEDASVATG